ncbi:MAG: type II toxin-antitoxin system RelE/ParE family toxin [Acidobacteriales bacterium]|nr:type II toxin-antitoxin system RelE/ParE family toxin [Terriglobales bacterium]
MIGHDPILQRPAPREELWQAGKSRRLPAGLRRVAIRKLAQLHFAKILDDLRAPPGNRLEALRGDRLGQHSIRINDQFRVCFVWRGGNACEVEIVGYHKG